MQQLSPTIFDLSLIDQQTNSLIGMKGWLTVFLLPKVEGELSQSVRRIVQNALLECEDFVVKIAVTILYVLESVRQLAFR